MKTLTKSNNNTVNLNSKGKQGKPDRKLFKPVNHPSEVLSLNFSQFLNTGRFIEPLISKQSSRTSFSPNSIFSILGLLPQKDHKVSQGKAVDFEQFTINRSGVVHKHGPDSNITLGEDLYQWIQ